MLPGAALRQVAARSDAEMIVCGYGGAVASFAGEEAPRGTPPWIA